MLIAIVFYDYFIYSIEMRATFKSNSPLKVTKG